MSLTWITSNRLSLAAYIPELILAVGCLLTLLLGSMFRVSRVFTVLVTVLSLFGFIFQSYSMLHIPQAALFNGAISIDSFAVFFKIFFGIVTLVTVGFTLRSREFENVSFPEVASFLLALTLSLSMMAASTNILMMYLSLEMVSVLSYIMVGFKKHSRTSSEAGLKYILYGAFSSGVMIFGLSYLFGLTGSADLKDIAKYFSTVEGISQAPILFFTLLSIMIGFGYKIATFPTQMWCPDVYEGAALPVTAFLSVGPKAAGFAMLIRFFVTVFHIRDGSTVEIFRFINWNLVLAVIAACTMTIGNLAAIPQRNLKRLMAYSSIAHAGYLLMGFSALNSEGIGAILFYLVAYLLMNFGAFLVILLVSNHLGTEDIAGYRGLGWRAPLLGIILTMFLFSLTGLPPFAGFIGKVFLFGAVIKRGMYWLAVIAALNTIVSLFYYARIIKAMFLESPVDPSPLSATNREAAIGLLFAIPTIVLGLYWEPLLRLAEQSVTSILG